LSFEVLNTIKKKNQFSLNTSKILNPLPKIKLKQREDRATNLLSSSATLKTTNITNKLYDVKIKEIAQF